MARIEQSILVASPVASVFDFVATEWQGALAFWPHGIRDWRPVATEPLAPGFRVRYRTQMLGLSFPMEMEVVAFERGRGWTATSVRGPRAEGQWEFAPEGDGTRFTYRLSYEMPPPLLGPILDRGFFAPAWRRAVSDALANLKRLIETRG